MSDEEKYFKLPKQIVEYLDNSFGFIGTTLIRKENFEIIDEPNLTLAIKNLGKAIKQFEMETGYEVKCLDIKENNLIDWSEEE